jgi:hypothetical protein
LRLRRREFRLSQSPWIRNSSALSIKWILADEKLPEEGALFVNPISISKMPFVGRCQPAFVRQWQSARRTAAMVGFGQRAK